MWYYIGEYAWPGLNMCFYGIAYAIVILSTGGAYSIWKQWNENGTAKN